MLESSRYWRVRFTSLARRHARSHFDMMKRILLIAVFATACAGRVTPNPGVSTSTPYDVVIENGRIVDGTGNVWFYGDLAISGDRIARVTPFGALKTASAKTRIDAKGLVVAPGFIDIQSHSWDALLWRDGRVIGKVMQGVTTEILGEATTPAPINANMLALLELPDTLPKLIALHKTFAGEHGFGAWLDAMGRHANSVNVGSYLGAATVRAYAKGQAAGPATAAELDTMRAVVRHAMEDGAFGMSSALIYPRGATRRPSSLSKERRRCRRIMDRTSLTCGRRTISCSRRWTKRSGLRVKGTSRSTFII